MIVIPGKTFLPGLEEVPDPAASPDPAGGLAGAAVVPFDPASISDPARFGSGEMAKRPRASPGGGENAGSATAGMGVSARKFLRSRPVTGMGEFSFGGSTFNCSTGFVGSGGFCEGSGDLVSATRAISEAIAGGCTLSCSSSGRAGASFTAG